MTTELYSLNSIQSTHLANDLKVERYLIIRMLTFKFIQLLFI